MARKRTRRRGIRLHQPQFGEYVRKRICELGWTTADLAQRYHRLLRKSGFLMQPESTAKYLQRIRAGQATVDEDYLQTLCEALDTDQETLERRGLIHVGSTSQAQIWNVPYPRNPFFTGREAILSQLSEALAPDRTPLTQMAAISGLGGIGKTQTAVE